jgi:hypothetical protein
MFTEQTSILTPLGLTLTLLMGVLLLVLPRRWALFPIIVITCYITFGQKIVIAGLNFTMLRVLVLFACARLILRMEFHSFRWLRIDTAVVLWVLSSIASYTLLWRTSDAFVNRLGFAYDAIGLYFSFRLLIRDMEDVKRACRLVAIALLPLALCMSIERITGRNPFFVFGGVPEFTQIREGLPRCQGPFRHPILAGTFGAAWLSLFVGLWWQGKNNRMFAVVGIVSATLITLLSGSSGPVGTYLASILALCMWPMRGYLRQIRWAILVFVLALHLMMKAPVWFILTRMSLISGSTGWHRANLIDAAVRNFFDWWLIGTRDTSKWGVWGGDITNQYLGEGVTGGLITLLLFLGIIVLAFSTLGKAMQRAQIESRRSYLLLWAAGSALFAHVITFLGVSYFDQNVVNWYLLLAMVGCALSVYGRGRQTAPRQAAQLENTAQITFLNPHLSGPSQVERC